MEASDYNDPFERTRGSGMRVVRLLLEGDCRYGLADESTVTLISDEPFAAWEPEGILSLADAHLLPPVAPTKIVCVGLNYRPHIAEMGHEFPSEPVLFLKPSTAVIGPGMPIPIPEGVGRVDYEAELGVVIGRRTHMASRDEAVRNVLGFTCANDVLHQQAHTSEMLFDPYELVSFASHVMTLVPGDIVLTGTPGGIGPLKCGDTVEVRIEGVGSLVNPVCTAA